MAGGSEKRELKPTEPFWKSTEPARPADAAPVQPRAEPDPRSQNNQIEARTLIVGAGMSVSGTVSYGEIEIECGGKISGQIKPHDRAASSSKPAQTGYVPLTGKPHESGSVGSNGSAPHLVSAGTAVLAAK